MADNAVQQTAARANWSSRYPFEPYQGGLGVSLSCTTSTARVALVGNLAGTDQSDNVVVIFNTGDVFAFVRLGDASVGATTACMAVPPGGALTISLYGVGQPVPMYVAGITASGAATLQATCGFGN